MDNRVLKVPANELRKAKQIEGYGLERKRFPSSFAADKAINKENRDSTNDHNEKKVSKLLSIRWAFKMFQTLEITN